MEGVRWRLATPIEWPSRLKLAQPRCVTVLLEVKEEVKRDMRRR